MRIILYTGKGGVGKTSMAAVSACQMAAAGKKVLLVSTDQAHSLGDSFDRKIGSSVVRIDKHLDAMEIDTVKESEKSWGKLKGYFRELLTSRGSGGIEVEELLVFPGLEELFALFSLLELYEAGEYEVLIVDCAPTGETLSLLKYPEKLSDMMEKILPMKRKSVKLAGPLIEKMTKIPMPEDAVFDDIEILMDKMERLQKLMQNKEIVSLRIVTTPEKIVLKEAKRNFTCLHLYNYNVDAIIVNRIYPRQALEGYFGKWEILQKESFQDISESFSEVPRFYFELQEKELYTLTVLKEAAKRLFSDQDISKVLFCQEIYKLYYDGEEAVLQILLPFAEKEELELEQKENELVLSVKNETRRFPLPLKVRDKEIAKAKFEDGYLKIRFQG